MRLKGRFLSLINKALARVIIFSMKYLSEILPDEIAYHLSGIAGITEIRLRRDRPVYYSTGQAFLPLTEKSGYRQVRADRSDIEYVIGKVSGQSFYAVNDTLIKGYLFYKGGIRIGATGEGVEKEGRLTTLKSISGLTIRVPHEIKGAADEIMPLIIKDGEFRNTLIISPPAGGKTTMLRDIARQASKGRNLLIIDERYELSAFCDGQPLLDVGETTDVIAGVGKKAAFENSVRAMNPDVIITDEIYTEEDCDYITEAVRTGVSVAASVHGKDLNYMKNSKICKILNLFKVKVVMSKTPSAGTVKAVYSE